MLARAREPWKALGALRICSQESLSGRPQSDRRVIASLRCFDAAGTDFNIRYVEEFEQSSTLQISQINQRHRRSPNCDKHGTHGMGRAKMNQWIQTRTFYLRLKQCRAQSDAHSRSRTIGDGYNRPVNNLIKHSPSNDFVCVTRPGTTATRLTRTPPARGGRETASGEPTRLRPCPG